MPILGADKSRVPFYIAGGVLVVWALIVSLGLGLRRPDFPGNQASERLVIAISAVLVFLTASMAVITSGSPAKAAGGSSAQSPAGGASSAPAAPGAATTAPAAAPKATTGTPPPPSSPAAGKASSSLQLSYDTKQLSAKAGTVTITMANMSPLEHNVTIAAGSTVLGATPTFVGGTRTLTLSLKPGTYTFYCSVPGHRAAGMEGTLTVS
jgi:plastocyanin